jgi:hypothetical protein
MFALSPAPGCRSRLQIRLATADSTGLCYLSLTTVTVTSVCPHLHQAADLIRKRAQRQSDAA